MSPSSTPVLVFTWLALMNRLTGNAPLVFGWLALARNVEIIRINTRERSSNQVLDLVESPHDNLDQKIY
jgi:hypothetical protein